MKKQLIISLIILSILLVGTVVVVLYGRGYRFGLDNGKIGLSGTGMLVATSNPDGAQVFIDGHLTTATDNTINLAPGQYNVRIYKEGYFSWEKTLTIKKEVVTKADALLFPTAPALESITSIGIGDPTVDPSFTRIAYTVSSQSARKNGIYILDMTQRPILTLQSSSTQITDDTIDEFSKAVLTWSPDGKQLLAAIQNSTDSYTTYLLNTNGFNDSPRDITATLATVQAVWDKDKADKEVAQKATLKPVLRKMIAENFNILAWSPDETKILYTASKSGSLSLVIKPRRLGIDTLREERNIKEGSFYVYDIKDDVNFKLDAQSSALRWFPDSKHILNVNNKKIKIMEYDGPNATTVYAGPFIDNYVFPWPNGSKVVILTDLGNKNIPANLYTISLK